MKNIITLVTFLFAAVHVNAQTNKHNFMVGGNLLTSSISFQAANTGYEIALQPKIGYFIEKNVAIGLSAELGVNAVKSNLTMNYGLTPFTRIYIGKSTIDDIPRQIMFYMEAGGGFGGRNSRFKELNGTKTNVTTNGGVFYVGPGIDLFLNKNVALELGTEYRYIGGSPHLNRVGINFGIQVFLSKGEAKKVYNDTEKDLTK